MNILTSEILDVQCDVQKDVQPLLDAHGSHIPNQVPLPVLQRRNWRHGFEGPEIGAVTDNKDILRIQAASRESKVPIAAIGCHPHVAHSVRQLFEPNLNVIESPPLAILRQ